VYLKQPYDIDAIWRKFASLFPLIITKEKEIAYTDEIDSFSLKYKGIIQDHKESSMSIIKRWKLLKNDYPHLVQVVKALLIIPYSTSTVESLFSEFRAFKTCYRNKLNVENLEASILTEQYFRKESPRILPEMLDKYFSMWNTDEKKKTASDEPRASEQIENSRPGTEIFLPPNEMNILSPIDSSGNSQNINTFLGTMMSMFYQQYLSNQEIIQGSQVSQAFDSNFNVGEKEDQTGKRKTEETWTHQNLKQMKLYNEGDSKVLEEKSLKEKTQFSKRGANPNLS